MTAIRKPWTPAENAALVHLYFAMLDEDKEDKEDKKKGGKKGKKEKS